MTDHPITDDLVRTAALAAFPGLPDGIDAAQAERRTRAALEYAAPILVGQALRDAADLVDRGPTFPLPPSVISALLRERADDMLAAQPSPA